MGKAFDGPDLKTLGVDVALLEILLRFLGT